MARLVWKHAGFIPTYDIDATIDDVDALALYDIDDDGKTDLVSADSLVANQKVYWYKQNSATSWTRYLIDGTAANFDASDIEGVAAFEIAGLLYVVSAAQDAGTINIYTPTVPGVPTGAWDYAELLTGRPWMQSLWAYDLDTDGMAELVFAWEGTNAASGGIRYLDFDGGDPMVAANWTEHTMAAHPGAFWIAHEAADMAGNGRADIAFVARDSGRNPDTVTGVYYLERPLDPTDPWTVRTIDARDSDWTRVEIGNFFGEHEGRDVVAIQHNNEYGIMFYQWSASYAGTSVAAITAVGDGISWNLRKIPFANGVSTGGRDALLIVNGHDYAYVYQFLDGEWIASPYDQYPTTEHSMEGPIEWLDLDDDGIFEAIIPDSSTPVSKLAWIKIGSGAAPFSPEQATTSGGVTPVAWYKADIAWALDTDIPLWPDMSGSGHNASAPTAADAPMMVTDTNGLPAIRFDGSNVLENNSFVMDLRARTIFFVARQTTDDGDNQGILAIKPAGAATDSAATDGLSIRVGASDGARPSIAGSTPTGYALTGTDEDVVALAIWCERKAQGGTGRLYKNGVEVASDATYTEFAAASGGGLLIGGRWITGALVSDRRLIGDIHEVLIYQGQLSAADTNEVGAYLERWGLTWTDIS